MVAVAIGREPAVEPFDLHVHLRRARHRRRWQFAGSAALLVIAMIAGLMIGPMQIPASDLWAWAQERIGLSAQKVGEPERLVIERIRLPRVALAALIGAALAMAGAAFQGLFRNPLADPGLIGVSAGGAFGAVGVIVFGHLVLPALPDWVAPYLLPLAAFAGSLAAILVIYRISLHDGHPVVATMLLAGVAINALAGAATGFLTFLANDQQVRDLTFWLLGSLGAATWPKVMIVAPGVLLGLALLPFVARALNALLLGESEAGHLGFDIRKTKWIVIGLAAVMVGMSVAFAGIIGFVGLVVPHAIRLAAGPDHRFLLPASALLGAALLVTADLFAKCIAAPAELPIGILTALLGAPVFLWLLLRLKGAWQP